MATTFDRHGYEVWVSKVPGRKKTALLCIEGKNQQATVVGYFNSAEAAEIFVNTMEMMLEGWATYADGKQMEALSALKSMTERRA